MFFQLYSKVVIFTHSSMNEIIRAVKSSRGYLYFAAIFICSICSIIDSLLSSSIVSLKTNEKRCIKKNIELRFPSCCEKQDGWEENTRLFWEGEVSFTRGHSRLLLTHMDSLFTTGNPSLLLWAGKDEDSFSEDKNAYGLIREVCTSKFEPNKWEYTESVVSNGEKKCSFWVWRSILKGIVWEPKVKILFYIFLLGSVKFNGTSSILPKLRC